MKKKIDIEKLLQWAMRDELPKGQAIAASSWDIVSQFMALGTRVDTGGYSGDGFGFMPGEPHPDALLVADAMRALCDEARFGDLDEVLPLFGDLVAIAGDAPAAIMMAVFNPRALVISNATRGAQPKWKFEAPTPFQMFTPFRDPQGAVRMRPLVNGVDVDGDIVAIRPNRGRAAKRDGAYSYSMTPRSPINWHDPSMLHIAECRAEYVAWHAALVALTHTLAGRLAAHAPQLPAAAAMPWITGATVGPRLRWVMPIHGYVEPALTPKRAASEKPIESPIVAESVAAYNRASRTKMRKAAAAQG